MKQKSLKTEFINLYGESDGEIRSFFSPGRVNLIGEHVDYNGGKVFPAALTMGTTLLVRKRADNLLKLKATDLPEIVVADVSQLQNYKHLSWGNYQIGTALMLQQAGYNICGMDMLYHDTVPHGSGLSSSAANEVVTGFAIASLDPNKSLDSIELAVLARKAENEYCGVNCGIMDQFASANGKKDHAILLNCSDLSYTHVPLTLGDYKIVVANTNVKHSLGDSKYNERRAQCEAALAILKQHLDISCLADVSPSQFEQLRQYITDSTIEKRAAHVVTECDRTVRSATALQAGDLTLFGQLINESHISLMNDYEVSCAELDLLALTAQKIDGVLGARMTGAGFGGCTVNIIKNDIIEDFIQNVGRIYTESTGLTADFYISEIGAGAHEIF